MKFQRVQKTFLVSFLLPFEKFKTCSAKKGGHHVVNHMKRGERRGLDSCRCCLLAQSVLFSFHFQLFLNAFFSLPWDGTTGSVVRLSRCRSWFVSCTWSTCPVCCPQPSGGSSSAPSASTSCTWQCRSRARAGHNARGRWICRLERKEEKRYYAPKSVRDSFQSLTRVAYGPNLVRRHTYSNRGFCAERISAVRSSALIMYEYSR